jgi:imidazolonepropionase-like amidohydrolase
MLAVALVASIAAPVARTSSPGAYAIKDAQIVTLTGKTISKGTVVIRNGLITDVGENVRIPADAHVIDGSGLTVYPGIIDGYTNLGVAAQPQRAGGGPGQGGGRAAQAAAAAQQDPDDALGDPANQVAEEITPGGQAIEDARSAGVTAALTSLRQGIFLGQSALINLAGDEPSKLVVRAPVGLTIQFTTTAGFFGLFPNSLMGTVAYIRQSFYDAMHYRDEHDRYERVKRGIQRPEYDKKLAALQPALKGEMSVIFVANSDNDINRALAISQEFKLKPIIAGGLYGYRVADKLKARGVPVILSVDFPRRPADMGPDDDETLRALRERAEVPKGASVLSKSGVKFAFTSSTLRPADFLANVRKAVDNGLSKDDALKALTINAAEILGVSDQLGTIETGKIANLVVTNGDLLARDAKVRYVFIDGQQIDIKEAPAQRPVPGGGRPGPAASPAGDWNLMIQSPQGEMSIKLSLRGEGEQFTGTLTGPTGAVPVKNVVMEGNQLRLSVSIPMGGETLEGNLSGTIEGDAMRGALSLGAFGSFDFTGTRPR